jgi:hypothetical protein
MPKITDIIRDQQTAIEAMDNKYIPQTELNDVLAAAGGLKASKTYKTLAPNETIEVLANNPIHAIATVSVPSSHLTRRVVEFDGLDFPKGTAVNLEVVNGAIRPEIDQLIEDAYTWKVTRIGLRRYFIEVKDSAGNTVLAHDSFPDVATLNASLLLGVYEYEGSIYISNSSGWDYQGGSLLRFNLSEALAGGADPRFVLLEASSASQHFPAYLFKRPDGTLVGKGLNTNATTNSWYTYNSPSSTAALQVATGTSPYSQLYCEYFPADDAYVLWGAKRLQFWALNGTNYEFSYRGFIPTPPGRFPYQSVTYGGNSTPVFTSADSNTVLGVQHAVICSQTFSYRVGSPINDTASKISSGVAGTPLDVNITVELFDPVSDVVLSTVFAGTGAAFGMFYGSSGIGNTNSYGPYLQVVTVDASNGDLYLMSYTYRDATGIVHRYNFYKLSVLGDLTLINSRQGTSSTVVGGITYQSPGRFIGKASLEELIKGLDNAEYMVSTESASSLGSFSVSFSEAPKQFPAAVYKTNGSFSLPVAVASVKEITGDLVYAATNEADISFSIPEMGIIEQPLNHVFTEAERLSIGAINEITFTIHINLTDAGVSASVDSIKLPVLTYEAFKKSDAIEVEVQSDMVTVRNTDTSNARVVMLTILE